MTPLFEPPKFAVEYRGACPAELRGERTGPVRAGDLLALEREPLWIYKEDERGTPDRLRGRPRRLALADETVTWGSYLGLLYRLVDGKAEAIRRLSFERRASVAAGEWINVGRCAFHVRVIAEAKSAC